jgi:hypothetical protein
VAQLVETHEFDIRWSQFFYEHNPSGRSMALGSNRNEYQEYICKGGRYAQYCHLHLPIVSKSGSLNLLEPSGPVIGSDLPLPTVRSESRCALRLRYIDFVVSNEAR